MSHRWLQRRGAGVWEASSTVPGTHWTSWSCERRQGIKHTAGLCVWGGGLALLLVGEPLNLGQ